MAIPALIIIGIFSFSLLFIALRDIWKNDERKEYKLGIFTVGFISIWICLIILLIIGMGGY
jgi:uncharacterized membrane protein SpoIIM required for sporulation